MDTHIPSSSRIDSRKRADVVRDRIVDLIRSGQYTVGDKLPSEPQLMDMFGVGRSSVRAAMQSLVGLGIVEIRPGTGAHVRRLSVSDLMSIVDGAFHLDYDSALHLHEVRTMLETTAARLAAHRRTVDDVDTMKQLISEFAIAHAAGQEDDAIEADLAFHRQLIEAAKNPILMSILDSTGPMLKQHRREYGEATMKDSSARLRVLREHDGIVEALEQGDAEQSVCRVAKHMRIIWEQIESVTLADVKNERHRHDLYFELLSEDE